MPNDNLENILNVFSKVSRPEILELYDTYTKHSDQPELIPKKLAIMEGIKAYNNPKLKSTSWVKMVNEHPSIPVERFIEEAGAEHYSARLAKLVLINESYGISKEDTLLLCRGFKGKKSTMSDIDHQCYGSHVLDLLGTINLMQNLKDKEISDIDPSTYRSIGNQILNGGKGNYVGEYSSEAKTFNTISSCPNLLALLGTSITLTREHFTNPVKSFNNNYWDAVTVDVSGETYREHLSIIHIYFIKYLTQLADTDIPKFIKTFNISKEFLSKHNTDRRNNHARIVRPKLMDNLHLMPMILEEIQKDIRTKQIPIFTLQDILQTELYSGVLEGDKAYSRFTEPSKYSAPTFVEKKGDIQVENSATVEMIIISKGNGIDRCYHLGEPVIMFNHPMMNLLTIVANNTWGKLPDNFMDLIFEGFKLTRMKLSFAQVGKLAYDITSTGKFRAKQFEVNNLDTIDQIEAYIHKDAGELYS